MGRIVFVLWIFWLFLTPNIAFGADHFPAPVPTSSSSVYLGYIQIEGVDAEIGDEVAFYDPTGVLCGQARITVPGQYGLVPIYGDDFTTKDVDEGAVYDDELTVIVWDNSENRELKDSCLILTGGDPQGSEFFHVSDPPPVWRNNEGFALDIDTVLLIGDVDGDCTVDLRDAVVALEIIGAYEISQDVATRSDVNADLIIGLHEVIYILQKISGIRQ